LAGVTTCGPDVSQEVNIQNINAPKKADLRPNVIVYQIDIDAVLIF
jgi:hypothetical protein